MRVLISILLDPSKNGRYGQKTMISEAEMPVKKPSRASQGQFIPAGIANDINELN
jgi:hypothetical protein